MKIYPFSYSRYLLKKPFLIISLGFILNFFMVAYKGVTLGQFLNVAKSALIVLPMVPIIVLGYCLMYFLVIALRSIIKYKLQCFNHWHYDHKQLGQDIMTATWISFIIIYLVVFQTTFKTLYAWQLMLPNEVDNLLHSLDRVFFGPALWWWGSQLFSYSVWQSMVVALDRFYMPWFAYQWFLVIYILFHDQSEDRNYFITFFLLIWIFGTTLGGICQSGGPFFYSYAPWHLVQMQGLELINQVTPLYAINTQAYLWQNYFDTHQMGLASGISAFPSMHIAMSLYVCWYAKARRCLVWLAYTGFVLTWIAALILGWHYVADGIGAMCVVYVAHFCSSALHKSSSSEK